jgi:hypothetical protein
VQPLSDNSSNKDGNSANDLRVLLDSETPCKARGLPELDLTVFMYSGGLTDAGIGFTLDFARLITDVSETVR